MLRLALPIVLLVSIAACDGTTDPVTSPAGPPTLAWASGTVDPAALTPAPPPAIQPVCREDGRWIICHTTQTIETVNQPVFDLSCGTIYETSTDIRHGIRWYVAADSVIVKRHVNQEVEGTWSLSPDGSGPTAVLTSKANWDDTGYTNPLDLDSGVRSFHGEITLRAPGIGVIAHIAGLDEADGTHHGVFRAIEDPTVEAKVCSALAAP